MSWRGSTTVSDRIFASLPYLLPLIDGLDFGRFLFDQFPGLQLVFMPLLPLIQIYSGIPFAGFIIFLALYLGVVRNENISHFIRFNTMQAILLDIILILCGLVVPILASGLPVRFVLETLYNMIFLGILAAFIYSVAQSFMGRYAEIPTLSDAVHMQVR
ncbi:Tic20 family protein [Kamptonema formosum]|uniref:Tic20 family protein n=1 Tax=Kamptonema formosum TaxID=331992 RepID=UPI0003477D13|nr:Tic20 family protein [Oscillatoria sp. PCC 10802]